MPRRILIADDEELERKALRSIIGGGGGDSRAVRRGTSLELVEAANGLEAIAAAETGPLACAFLDIRMPGLDGLEVGARIKMRRPETAIVFLTAFDSFEYARRALRIGAGEFLLKPAAADEVLAALDRALGTTEDSPAESPLAPVPPGFLASLLDPVVAAAEPLGTLLALRALEFMAAHLGEALSLEGVAEALRSSSSHLSRVLSRHAGSGFSECLGRLRVAAAKPLLTEGSRSVKELSLLVGFSDPAYFARVFRKLEGMTPLEFRENAARRSLI